MRIISKFHDYYDCAMAQGIDSNLIYKRDREFVVVTEQDLGGSPFDQDIVDRCIRLHSPQLTVLSFCGKAYPFFMPGSRWSYWSSHVDIREDSLSVLEDGQALIKRAEDLRERKSTFIGTGRYRKTGDPFFPDEDRLDSFLDDKETSSFWGKISKSSLAKELEPFQNKSTNAKAHHVLECPVMLIVCLFGRYVAGPRRFAIVKNPCLKDMGFVRYFDPFSAYQEIAMFLGGVMARADEAPLRVGTDEVIAKQKGFDEWSFRTMPPGQKKLNRKANRERKKGTS